jgi:hypothetical protein
MPEQVNSLQGSFWLMVILQTIGSIDMPGHGARKLPSPRAYAAIIITWGVLQLVADTGRERAAKAVAWVIVLAGMVLGPFGTTVTNLFYSVATSLAPAGTGSATVPYPTPIPPEG